jgi:hypothetical protein
MLFRPVQRNAKNPAVLSKFEDVTH